MKKIYKILVAVFGTALTAQAQNVGIGTATPNASARLDISSTNSGVLIPRVSLTSTAVAAPVTAPATSLLVYNTNTAGDVTPGFYYWNGTAWVRLAQGNVGWEITGNNGITAANFLGTINAADLIMRTNNTERMRVLSGGNVGIGDATPAALFTVGNGDLFQVVATGHTRTIDGTAALPAFSFTGDTDNGIFRPGNDLFGIATGGTERVRIDAAGNVGVNTAANPSAILHLNANNRGLSIPNVALTATNAAAPVTAPIAGLMVYNTATAGAGATAVTPGHYYWTGTAWSRLNNNAWVVGTNTATTNALTADGFLGTSTNHNVDLVTNNTVRGRLSNLGEFFIGATTTVIAGDLMNGVSNATFPWAVNGYSSQNGSGVYGLVQGGATIFAGVQGEYQGTNAQGAGVRGIYLSGTAGTGFATPASGVTGTATSAGSYKFGVWGSGGSAQRSGGVMGYDYGIAMGALGYWAATGNADYAVYGFGMNYQTGAAAGKPVQPGGGLDNTLNPGAGGPQLKQASSGWTLPPNSYIGLGIYGGMMGGWVRGLHYGFHTKGEAYSMYIDGKGYTNEPLAYLMPTATDERVAGYMATSMTPEVTDKGKTALKNGKTFVAFSEKFRKVMSDNLDDLIITATPQGNSQGIYIQQVTPEGFWVFENNNGQSNVSLAWTVISPVKRADTGIASELLDRDFDRKMDGVMFNDNNTQDTPQSMWWDGTQIRWDASQIQRPAPTVDGTVRPKE